MARSCVVALLLSLSLTIALHIGNTAQCALQSMRRYDSGNIRLCAEVGDDDDAGLLAGSFWDELKEEASLEAEELGLTIKSMKFVNGKLDIAASGAGIDELQQLNSHLSTWIDTEADQEVVEGLPPFLLQVSSPGLSSVLTSDLDFTAFKGFPVICTTSEPFKNKTKWEGTLVSRDEKHVTINLKGRAQKIPVELVAEVRMPDAKREAGDMMVT